MSTFSKKVEREVSLLECDLCGARQEHECSEPVMYEFPYSETVEGSHGHDYTRMQTLHLCMPRCHDRVGQIISVLKAKRMDPKWAKEKFGKLFLETLDKLLDEP